MWKPGANLPALPRAGAFDAVLEPGEIAADADRGPTVARREEARVVGPIVYLDRSDVLERAEAERELGLEPGRTNVLVALGQGPEVRDATARCLTHLSTRDDVQVASLGSPIGDVVELRATYPMSRFYAAFDAVVAAAGYNAYHELLRLGPPALFVPMTRETDDQAARARYAAEAGLGRAVTGPAATELEAELDALLDPDERAAIRARLGALEIADGAREAAEWLVELAAPALGDPAVSERQRARGRRFGWHLPGGSPREAAEFLARVPRGVAALGKQLVTSPRPPRTVVLALGLDGAGLEAELPGVLERAPDPPERVLVITDSLDFAPLRRAGVGFEHVPARGELQPELAGGDYDSFLRHRLALILAERRRPRRVIAVGHAGEAALQAAI
jgi:hypothetical protein